MGIGGTSEKLAVAVSMGTCHSNFTSVRRMNQRHSKVPQKKNRASRNPVVMGQDHKTKSWKMELRATAIQKPDLPKKGVCVFSWIYSGKNAYALFGQPSKLAKEICTTMKSHFPPVKRAIWKKCKIQKGRTGHGELGALLCWWAGCQLPTATREKCMVFPETSKKQSNRA